LPYRSVVQSEALKNTRKVRIIDKIVKEEIPIRLYNNEFLIDFDRVLATGSPQQTYLFLKRCNKRIDKIINFKEIENSLQQVRSKRKKIC